MSRASKFLTLVLRHDPGRIGLSLGPGGWVATRDLLRALSARLGFGRRAAHPGGPGPQHRSRSRPPGGRAAGDPVPRDRHRHAGHDLPGGAEARLAEPCPSLTKRADRDTCGRTTRKADRAGVAAGTLHRSGALFLLADNGVWPTAAVPPSALALAAVHPGAEPAPCPGALAPGPETSRMGRLCGLRYKLGHNESRGPCICGRRPYLRRFRPSGRSTPPPVHPWRVRPRRNRSRHGRACRRPI